MKMHYDEKSDALCLLLDDSQIVEFEEAQAGIAVQALQA